MPTNVCSLTVTCFLIRILSSARSLHWRGKKPFVKHINTIVDYTFFLVYCPLRALQDLWRYGLFDPHRPADGGDYALLPETRGRRRLCAGSGGDWVFIDWADMDKTEPCAVNRFYGAKALECYTRLSAALGRPVPAMEAKIKDLRGRIFEKFYDPAAGAFIDSYESGRQNITRHSNILAYLFLPCDEGVKTEIYKKCDLERCRAANYNAIFQIL